MPALKDKKLSISFDKVRNRYIKNHQKRISLFFKYIKHYTKNWIRIVVTRVLFIDYYEKIKKESMDAEELEWYEAEKSNENF